MNQNKSPRAGWRSLFLRKFIATFLLTFGIATAAMPLLAAYAASRGDFGLALEFAAVGFAGAILVGVVVGFTSRDEIA